MYKHIVLTVVLIGAGLNVEAKPITKKKISGTVIDTQANTVGIDANDVCYWQAKKKTIRCSSGKVIKNPIQKESALTGTPGYLSGEHFIGYIVTKPSTPSLMGSGKRVDFYERQSPGHPH